MDESQAMPHILWTKSVGVITFYGRKMCGGSHFLHESLARVPYKEWMRGMKTRGEGRAKFPKKIASFRQILAKEGVRRL